MRLSEADTRAKLIDPALHFRGWTEDLLKREESAGAIYVVDGVARKRAKGRVDYTLRVKVDSSPQPVAVALIEAKAEHLPPTHGLEQAKLYAASKRLQVPFVFSSNGHLFVEYDQSTGLTSDPRPMTDFPAPHELRARYEHAVGIRLDEVFAKPLLASLEARLVSPDRVRAMTQDLFNQLLATGGPEQKTIVFCVRDRHSDDVANALNNLYAAWCAKEGRPRVQPYAFKCTGSVQGSDSVPDFRAGESELFRGDHRRAADDGRRRAHRSEHRLLQVRSVSDCLSTLSESILSVTETKPLNSRRVGRIRNPNSLGRFWSW